MNLIRISILLIWSLPVFAQINSLEEGLIFYAPFNDSPDDITDNWTLEGSSSLVSVQDRFGQDNSAYSFNGESDFLSFAHSDTFSSITNAYTITVWVNVKDWFFQPGAGNYIPILNKSNQRSILNFYFMPYETNIGANPCVLPPVNGLEERFNQWSFWVLKYDGNTLTYYIDGKAAAQQNCGGQIQQNQLPLLIGQDIPGATEYFDGRMDALRIYNRAITDAEIQQLYTENDTAPIAPTALVATSASSESISLSWQDNAFNENFYVIKRSTSPNSGYEVIDTISVNSTSYQDTNLSANTTYYYQVSAVNLITGSSASITAQATTFNEIALDQGLFIHFPFDGTTDERINQSPEPIINRGQLTRDRAGILNQAYAFDGSTSIQIKFPSSIVMKDFSYALWIKTENPDNNWQTIVDLDADKQYLGIRYSKLENYGRCGTNETHSGGTITEQWHHVVWTVKDARYMMYVDGQLVKVDSSCSPSEEGTTIMIGSLQSGNFPFTGAMDDIRIYNRAISPEEIQVLSEGSQEPRDAYLALENMNVVEEGVQNIKVLIGNTGTNAINDVTVGWSLNGQGSYSQDNLTAIQPQSTDTITLLGTEFKPETIYSLKVWVDQVNGQPDANPSNDTATVAPIFVNPQEPHFALALDGDDDFVIMDTLSDAFPEGSAACTIEFWVKTNQPQQGAMFAINYADNAPVNNKNKLLLMLGAGNQSDGMARVYDNRDIFIDEPNLVGTINVTDGIFHHIAYTLTNGLAQLYIDGILQGSYLSELTLQSDDRWSLGQEYDNNNKTTDHFIGHLDEVRVWQEARTQNQIREWMVKNRGLINQQGLVAAYHFSEDGGNQAFDRTGQHPGTLMEGVSWIRSDAPIGDNLPSVDAGVTSVLTQQQPPSQQATFFAVLRNFGTRPLTQATLRWSLNGQRPVSYPWTGNLLIGGQDTVSLRNQSLAGQGQGSHRITVWSENPNGEVDRFPQNDTASSEEIYSALAGIYTIGGENADFEKIQDAANALNQRGIAGDVTFNISPGFYDEEIFISGVPGSSCERRIILQSATKIAEDVVIGFEVTEFGKYVIEINDVAGVILKNLTIQEIARGLNPVIGISNQAHCITIEDNHLISKLESSSSFSNYNNVITVEEDGVTQKLLIQNNIIQDGNAGIVINSNNRDITIKENRFIGQEGKAISVEQSSEVTILANQFITPEPVDGISLSSINEGLIANNYLSIPASNGNFGLQLENVRNTRVYFNSVHLFDTTNTATASSALVTNQNNDFQLYNNIFSNEGGGLSVTASGAESLPISDYNNFFSSGEILASINSQSISVISDWQDLSGRDQHSVSVDPLFINDSTYRVVRADLDQAGIALDAVKTDIEQQPRDSEKPDIGADEFTLLPNDISITKVLTPQSGCDLEDTSSLKVEVTNMGSQPQTNIPLGFVLGNNEMVTDLLTDELAPGQSQEFTFTQPFIINAQEPYVLRIFSQLVNDENSSNDTIIHRFQNYGIPGKPTNLTPSENNTNLDVPLTLSWSETANTDSYDLYLWKEGDKVPDEDEPYASNLEQIRYTIRQRDLADENLNYLWKVVAKNNYCEEVTESEVQTYSLRPLPDLIVEQRDITPADDNNIFYGSPTAVQISVRNIGAGSTPNKPFSANVYLSLDPNFSSRNDRYIGSVAFNQVLGPGETSEPVTLNFKMPNWRAGANEGDDFYYYVVVNRN